MQQGEARILERQLIKRFGSLSEEIRQRLAQARPEQLAVWSERLLDGRRWVRFSRVTEA
ncbi:MAG: DUF4351 domain-containing protein [Candidatus Competibacteraceae bacterium]|nr:DUF4351 domain-containing protein [Candidatus Competibacteraceae bacterium]